MKAIVFPGPLKEDQLTVPPSKSMAHRAVICASLARGVSHIHHVDLSQDVLTTIEGMRQLGAQITIRGTDLEVIGTAGRAGFQIPEQPVFCNESGSTLRFFIPLFSLTGAPVRFTGKNRLLQRPQTVYEQLFYNQGLRYRHDEDELEIEGALRPGEITLRGDVSSQFNSGLMMALALTEQDSVLRIQPPFESRSYVELTMQMMAQFQVRAVFEDELTIRVFGNQCYQACETTVESDYSQMAFFAALGSINSELGCRGLRLDSLQGDRQMVQIVQAMGGQVHQSEQQIRFVPARLQGCEVDLNNCPDLGPILMVLASFARGQTHITHAGRLRYKESDRIEAMETELRKLGVSIRSGQDDILIEGPTRWKGGVELDGHRDHRIVMALAVGATMAQGPVTINGAQAVAKSYPGFFDDLRGLGIGVKEIQDEG